MKHKKLLKTIAVSLLTAATLTQAVARQSLDLSEMTLHGFFDTVTLFPYGNDGFGLKNTNAMDSVYNSPIIMEDYGTVTLRIVVKTIAASNSVCLTFTSASETNARLQILCEEGKWSIRSENQLIPFVNFIPAQNLSTTGCVHKLILTVNPRTKSVRARAAVGDGGFKTVENIIANPAEVLSKFDFSQIESVTASLRGEGAEIQYLAFDKRLPTVMSVTAVRRWY